MTEHRLYRNQGRLTLGPVPVRLSTLITALRPQGTLEIGNVGTMPGQEQTGEMDLSGEIENEPNDRQNARPVR